jgi:hypothetical protein
MMLRCLVSARFFRLQLPIAIDASQTNPRMIVRPGLLWNGWRGICILRADVFLLVDLYVRCRLLICLNRSIQLRRCIYCTEVCNSIRFKNSVRVSFVRSLPSAFNLQRTSLRRSAVRIHFLVEGKRARHGRFLSICNTKTTGRQMTFSICQLAVLEPEQESIYGFDEAT